MPATTIASHGLDSSFKQNLSGEARVALRLDPLHPRVLQPGRDPLGHAGEEQGPDVSYGRVQDQVFPLAQDRRPGGGDDVLLDPELGGDGLISPLETEPGRPLTFDPDLVDDTLRLDDDGLSIVIERGPEIDLGPHILLGRGEAAAGGAEKPSILSDAFEAVLGAVYLDGGSEAAYLVVERLVGPRLAGSVDQLDQLDHKTQLQELSARQDRGAPVYEVTSTGPDHAKSFSASAVIDGEVVGTGIGRSKKAAEQAAAEEACALLERSA